MHAMSGGDASRRPVAISKQWQPAASKVSIALEKSIVKNATATIIVEPESKPLISSPSASSSPSIWMLALCAGGICTSYLWYGMIEERLHMSPGMPPMTAFLLVSQCITNVLVAKTYSTVLFPSEKPKNEKRSLCHPLFLLTSFCFFASMLTTGHSLHYVSYPVQVLAKSSKLIPTMVVGLIVERKRYSAYQWIGATSITVGILIFNLSQHYNRSSDEKERSSLYGLCLLGFALAMDGLLGSCQGLLKKQRKNYRAPDAMETMLYVNLYAILFLLPTALYTGHWKNGMELLMQEDSEFPLIFLLLNGMAAAGQICIFFTIHLYSPLMCTTITTTRKFITVFLSVQKFRHAFSPIEWSCVAFVFGGVYLEIASKVKTAPPPPSTTKKLQ